MWQSSLKALSIPDWLIIVVVHNENQVKSKILRTSVYDKVKSEFGSRSSSRCVCFIHDFSLHNRKPAYHALYNGMVSHSAIGCSELHTHTHNIYREKTTYIYIYITTIYEN